MKAQSTTPDSSIHNPSWHPQIWLHTSLHFVLRNPKDERPSQIIAIIKVGMHHSKVYLPIKASPKMWCPTTQRCKISSHFSTVEKFNSTAANNLLEAVAQHTAPLLEDIGNHALDFNKESMKRLANNIKTFAHKPKEFITECTPGNNQLIAELQKFNDSKTQNTRRQYSYNLSNFCKYLTENRLAPTISNITYTVIYNYKIWLERKDSTGNYIYSKHGATMYLNYIINALKSLRNKPDIMPLIDDSLYKIDTLKIGKELDKVRTKQDREASHVILSKDEIITLESLNLPIGNLSYCRDIMLLQAYLGCRRSDIVNGNIFNHNNLKTYAGTSFIVFTPHKTRFNHSQARVPLNLFKNIMPLWSKYKDTRLKCSKETYGANIKKICRLVPSLCEKTEYLDAHGIRKSKPKYEIISSHDLRHTFISRCIVELKLTSKDVIAFTGHKDDKTIIDTYMHLNDEYRAEQALSAFNKAKHNTGESDTSTRLDRLEHRLNSIQKALEE